MIPRRIPIRLTDLFDLPRRSSAAAGVSARGVTPLCITYSFSSGMNYIVKTDLDGRRVPRRDKH